MWGKRGKSRKKISVVKPKNKYGVKAKENPKVMKDMGETKRESEVDERLCVCVRVCVRERERERERTGR